MANLGINVGTDKLLGADEVDLNGDTGAFRQLVGESYANVGDGRKVVTTAGTRVQLVNGAVSDPTCRQATITAELDNTGVIVVGGVTCVASLSTRRGHPLEAGDSVTLPVLSLESVYIDSTVSGDGVTWIHVF